MQLAFDGSWQDRNSELRNAADYLQGLQARPEVQVLPVWRGKAQISGAKLAWVGAQDAILRHASRPWLFLGQQNDRPLFAADISDWEPEALDRAALAMFADPSVQIYPGAERNAQFLDLRLAMIELNATEAALAGTARAVFNWHRTHRFCARCGAQSDVVKGGWERLCAACGAQHFPRTDPVVIMLVLHGNSVLLGRSQGWPDGLYSALAGFVEPGESLENAVAREVFEETGIETHEVRYLASQPWPFPNSLMLGCVAKAHCREIRLDAELEDARWMSREAVLAAWSGDHTHFTPARPGSIAHYMLGQWLAGRV